METLDRKLEASLQSSYASIPWRRRLQSASVPDAERMFTYQLGGTIWVVRGKGVVAHQYTAKGGAGSSDSGSITLVDAALR